MKTSRRDSPCCSVSAALLMRLLFFGGMCYEPKATVCFRADGEGKEGMEGGGRRWKNADTPVSPPRSTNRPGEGTKKREVKVSFSGCLLGGMDAGRRGGGVQRGRL